MMMDIEEGISTVKIIVLYLKNHELFSTQTDVAHSSGLKNFLYKE